jgi:hypothetical protein
MRWKRLSRWAMVVAATLIAMGLWPARWRQAPGGGDARVGLASAAPPNQGTGGKDRVVTLTVWVCGSGQAQWDAMTNDPRDGPGTTIRKSALNDTTTAYCMGVAHYRVKRIREDKDGGLAELEKIDSSCTTLGISGGGQSKGSYDYTSKYPGGGKEWEKDQASWTYQLGPLQKPWRGPELDFHSSKDFSILPPALPVGWDTGQARGKGVWEASREGRRETTTDFRTEGRKAVEDAFGAALITDKSFQEKLHGQLDWSKPVCVTGHATFSQTKTFPIVLVYLGEEVSGGNGTSQGTIDLTWTVSDQPPIVEMDMIPQEGYEKWLPRGGKDEKTSGPGFAVKIDIHKMGQPGVAPDAQVTKLTVWLADTSKEKGLCMNYPKSGTSTSHLGFRIKHTPGWTVTEEDQHAQADHPHPQSAVILNCYDYGGWTNVMATAELADGQTVVARAKGGSQGTQLSVPKDDNHNHVADGWEEGRGWSPDATADTDGLPQGDGVDGDGLSFYEEYRGFRCKGVHTRTDPVHKDLFIYDQNDLGIGCFGDSGITVHFVDKDEFGQEDGARNPNVINCNRGYAALGAQHLLFLRNFKLSESVLGSGNTGLPKDAEFVNIDADKNKAVDKNLATPNTPSTIAHELAHCCNVWHHGESDYVGCDFQDRDPAGNWKYEYPPETRGTVKFAIAAMHGQTSGVQACIMRYRSANFYECADGDRRWHKEPGEGEWITGFVYPSGLQPGTVFCGQKQGTGINSGGLAAGDAARGRGDCIHQLQINDLKPARDPGSPAR